MPRVVFCVFSLFQPLPSGFLILACKLYQFARVIDLVWFDLILFALIYIMLKSLQYVTVLHVDKREET